MHASVTVANRGNQLYARVILSDIVTRIHHGRHTFISHAMAGGRTLAEVRDAAGHANVSITSGYLHVAVDNETAIGTLFA
jgi:site-specific recombinase XerD